MQMKTTVGYHYTPITITKIKIVPTPNADGDKEKPHPSYIAGGWKRSVPVENSLAVSKKLNMQLTYDPAIAHLLRNAKFCSCKHLSLNVYSSLIHYSLKVKTTQMPFKGLAKQTVYTHIMEYYS